jgi:hypothetical protein
MSVITALANVTAKVGGVLSLFSAGLCQLYVQFPLHRSVEDGSSESISGSLVPLTKVRLTLIDVIFFTDMRTAAQKAIPTTPVNYYSFIECNFETRKPLGQSEGG